MSPATLELVSAHCGRCHNQPDPASLSPEVWEWVLDWMGNYLGYPSAPSRTPRALLDKVHLPPGRLVSESDWKSIRTYFIENAGREAPVLSLPLSRSYPESTFGPFRETNSQFNGIRGLSVVSSIRPLPQEASVLFGEASTQRILKFDLNGNSAIGWDKLHMDPVAMFHQGDDLLALQMGHLQGGWDGELLHLQENGRKSTLAYGLLRPAEAVSYDPGGNGEVQVVVACHGVDAKGGLYRLIPGVARYEIQPILETPGLVSVQQGDLDGDGDKDLVVLRSRGSQEIIILRNTDESWEGLTAEIVLSQGPSLGYMQGRLVDIDGDEHLDLAVLAGNNFEIPRYPSRPYHGIYLYAGDGQGSFRNTHTSFQHIPGASVLEWADFDQDGDLDVVVGACLVDWSRGKPHGVVCGWNQGDFQFRWEKLSAAPTIALGISDLNDDGYPDILAGSFNVNVRVPIEQRSAHDQITQRTPWIRRFLYQPERSTEVIPGSE